MYTVGSLFAGIGGIEKGFEEAGAKLSWANEIDSAACITYRKNYNHTLFEGDLNVLISKAKSGEFEFPKVDILTAGFPCQAFSIAGYRKGFNDERGNLFFSIMKMVELIRPKALFLENVKNLRTHDNGRTYKIIRDALDDAEYTFTDFVLNTMEYGGVPQNRERIYILCFDKNLDSLDQDTHENLESILLPDKVLLKTKVRDLLEDRDLEDRYYYNEEHQYYDKLNQAMKNPDTVYQWRRVYVRENQSNVCPTLTANMGTGGHNVPLIRDSKGIRKLTPRECFRLQGFTDDYKLPDALAVSHLYKQAGNSVSVPVVRALADKMLNLMSSRRI
ncbi:DNA (cytosine-5-)-methyltransferase [Pleomorphochaeta sp. DL1XJH-081]|uniref:DNA (cytosine-5-)-methyltransferase n=1 Tax=Pleomorphochaeta sp. DL1XJH-081 TaxID=3409690 RepID=UPI003BB799F5